MITYYPATVYVLSFLLLMPVTARAGEVFDSVTAEIPAPAESPAQKSLTVVSQSTDGVSRYRLPEKQEIRPDYRLLELDVKSGEIPYSGPVSSRTKVYVLAGALAAGGIVGAAAMSVAAAGAAPSAAGAAGLGAGAGLAATGTGAIAYTYKTNSESINTTQIAAVERTSFEKGSES